jgi:hypothetical protein
MTWRTRTDESGVVWRERPKPGTSSTIERERIPVDWNEGGIIRPGAGIPQLTGGGIARSTATATGKLRFYPSLEPTRDVTLG